MVGETIPLDIAPASRGRTGITRRYPIGPVAGISPFNFPLNLAAHKVAPAIAAGCPFVLKPSDRTPVSAALMAEVLAETDLPEGAFSVLPTRLEDVGPFIEDDRLKLLSFTGSEKVGWGCQADKHAAWRSRDCCFNPTLCGCSMSPPKGWMPSRPPTCWRGSMRWARGGRG